MWRVLFFGAFWFSLAGCQTTQGNLRAYKSLWGTKAPSPSLVRQEPPRRHKPNPRYLGSAQAYSAYLAGRMLAQEQRHRKAIQAFKVALVHDPNSAFLYFSVAQQHTQLGQWVKAIYWSKRAIEVKKSYSPAHHLLGRIYWILRNERLAKASYRQAIKNNPRYLAAYLDLERLLARSHQYDARKKLLKKLIKYRNEAHQGYFALAQIYQKEGDLGRALSMFQEAVNRKPSHVEALYHMARIYGVHKKIDASVRHFLLLLDYQPEAWQARMELAAIFLQRRAAFDEQRAAYQLRYVMREATQMEAYERAFRVGATFYEKMLFADATKWLLRALRYHRRESTADMSSEQRKLHRTHEQNIRFYLALSWRAEGQIRKALDEFRRIRAVSKAIRIEAQAYQIELLAEVGRYRESRELLKRIRTEKTKYRRWIRLSQAFAERATAEDLDQETRALKDLMKRWSEPEESWMHLSYLYFKQRQWELCERWLKKLLVRNARHAGALNFMGYVLAEQGKRLPEAEKLVQQALQLEPGNPSYLDSLGWIYFRMGQFAKAEAALRKASDRLPRDAAVLIHLALLYQRIGRLRKALVLFRRARALRPEPSLQRKIESNIQALRRRMPQVDVSRSSRPFRRQQPR
ncbi:MAG: tetratricopeptide repeat protein [Myxococcales bacterium]|nr:tetratricopeptide repeat protein [Myxococcales bacterium]MCB9643626.1 tetratricopeptide repeat protein [Myxococcales bacterium]